MPSYAHRELDLALMELRASPEPSFFEGYREELPIDEGYEFRQADSTCSTTSSMT